PFYVRASLDPAAVISSLFKTGKQACASCQLAALLVDSRNSSICSSLPNCNSQWENCEIVRNLPAFGFENYKNDRLDWIAEMALSMRQDCEKEMTTNLAAMGPTTSKCVQCILVYELLRYFHNNVIGVNTEQAILQVIGQTCFGGSIAGIFLQNFCNDAQLILHAIFNGLRDSMEGLYDLIGCSLLGCPALPEFLCSCIGEKCS
uniref:Saposin B-type domain-containing protein n=1 Tax=Parascaris univalens TaxID=6257 RepID=A0A915A5F3_PARUN